AARPSLSPGLRPGPFRASGPATSDDARVRPVRHRPGTVGAPTRIVFLTTDDPIYLPAFFERVLGHWATETVAVYMVPPLYRNQSRPAAAWRYHRTFGTRATVELARRIFEARLMRQSISSSCERYGVPCAMAADVNTREFIGELAALRPDLVVSVSCPQIFKRELIEIPPKGCLNVHGAVLPNYRGVMPSFWMLANG